MCLNCFEGVEKVIMTPIQRGVAEKEFPASCGNNDGRSQSKIQDKKAGAGLTSDGKFPT